MRCFLYKHVSLDVFAFPSTARGEPWEIRFVVKNSSFDIRDTDRATCRKNPDVSWLDLKGMKKYGKHSKTIKRSPKKNEMQSAHIVPGYAEAWSPDGLELVTGDQVGKSFYWTCSESSGSKSRYWAHASCYISVCHYQLIMSWYICMFVLWFIMSKSWMWRSAKFVCGERETKLQELYWYRPLHHWFWVSRGLDIVVVRLSSWEQMNKALKIASVVFLFCLFFFKFFCQPFPEPFPYLSISLPTLLRSSYGLLSRSESLHVAPEGILFILFWLYSATQLSLTVRWWVRSWWVLIVVMVLILHEFTVNCTRLFMRLCLGLQVSLWSVRPADEHR